MPPWVLEAEKYLGTKEIPGKKHNPTIVDWLTKWGQNLGSWGRARDETPWCSVFVAACLEACGIRSTRHALAASWVSWGRACGPIEGAVVVLRYKGGRDAATGSRAGYHVGFLVLDAKNSYRVLGGNQGNKVSFRNFPKRMYSLEALRWPKEYLLPSEQVAQDTRPELLPPASEEATKPVLVPKPDKVPHVSWWQSFVRVLKRFFRIH